MVETAQRNRREMPSGTRVAAGSAAELDRGAWRTMRPVTDVEACTHCLQCWIFCPDGAVQVGDGKKTGTVLRYCKGCGICAAVCPAECIEMRPESEMRGSGAAGGPAGRRKEGAK